MFANAGGGWEYPAFLIAASLALFLQGDAKRARAA
jgi:putative oxidoreductase